MKAIVLIGSDKTPNRTFSGGADIREFNSPKMTMEPSLHTIIASIENATLLKRAASLDDVGRVAAFIASDQARTITAADINISSGGIMD